MACGRGETREEGSRRGAGLSREGRGGQGVGLDALALRFNLRQVRPAGRDRREELAPAQPVFVGQKDPQYGPPSAGATVARMGRKVTVATCALNQWALDFEGNLQRILKSESGTVGGVGAGRRARLVCF